MDQVQIESKYVDKKNEIMVVELNGHIDQSNSYQLQKMFDNIIQTGCYKVIVDFGKLYYMSSAGWGVFIGEIKRFRDNGGDIKLANMNSDIYDVFQMLEFYHILEDYANVTEAASSFSGNNNILDLTKNPEIDDKNDTDVDLEKEEKSHIQENQNKDFTTSKQEIIEFVPDKSKWNNSSSEREIVEQKLEKTINLKHLPLPQKIRYIVGENPLLGVWGMKKILHSNHFGSTKVSVFKLMKVLRELDLNSREKRYRYYRSC